MQKIYQTTNNLEFKFGEELHKTALQVWNSQISKFAGST